MYISNIGFTWNFGIFRFFQTFDDSKGQNFESSKVWKKPNILISRSEFVTFLYDTLFTVILKI